MLRLCFWVLSRPASGDASKALPNKEMEHIARFSLSAARLEQARTRSLGGPYGGLVSAGLTLDA